MAVDVHDVPGNAVVLHDAGSRQWLLFDRPRDVVAVWDQGGVIPALERIDRAVSDEGLFAAGFVSYEAAPAFDDALCVREPGAVPLLWFGLYPEPERVRLPSASVRRVRTLPAWTPTVSAVEYAAAITRIREYIAAGDTYQVNYTLRLRTAFRDEPWPFFLRLQRAQQTVYGAYVDTGAFVICSSSPELFFRLDGSMLTSRPMKGTAARGRTLTEDAEQAAWLRHSEKNQAENVMIVDMVRNDMGRIAVVGSVDVTRLYDVERYPTVWQMTSTVQARTHASLPELMRALFPCASITGAPKPRTMQIIAELETTPRGVYTGAIGFMAPGPRAQFNVAIRTVVLDRATGQAEYGVGGGILWDSESAAEYEECRIKAQVLTRRSPDFALLETLLWTPEDGYFLLSRHLSRLRDSAEYFGIPLDLDRVRKLLDREASRFAGRPHRMRLLVAGDGLPVCECMPWPAPGDAAHDRNGPVRLRFAREPIDAADPFMFHKTTSRAVYEAARAGVTDADDVLLWNVRGEVTETSIANIVVAVDNTLVTPPVSCGLLAGTFRAWLLERHEVEERVIMRSDLTPETRMYVVNSVRGRREARLVLD